ncbi:tRNA pseudouridine(38-40) synthase TruA [Peribacillus sp. SCS-37]|uniref:tRNA pseudouridine(38-40) synthase TruA n=1 Tax=Paraperibacillus esterisolvens TaxID=3115296 RepID=UPI003906235D
MQRYKCTVAYDGTLFAGYQVQPDKRTVQSEMERVLQKLHKGQSIKISASGRTDAGVHARGQVIHFDSPLSMPPKNWLKALNSNLPGDISVLKVEEAAPGFHARFDAAGKEYRYVVSLGHVKDPFRRHYAYQPLALFDLEAMREACLYITGTHDFTSFCSAKTEVEDKVRTITYAGIDEKDGELIFRYVGSGFLYNMVRILTGTILEVGRGKRAPAELVGILEKRDRSCAGKTAPGHGLYLWEVFYQ